jgi:hypothetical protein
MLADWITIEAEPTNWNFAHYAIHQCVVSQMWNASI